VLSLDGDGDYVEMVDDPSLDAPSALTMEAWINPGSTATYKAIVGKFVGAPYRGYDCYFHDGKIGCDVRATSGQVGCGSLSNIPVNQWTHVAYTYDGISTSTMYINGNLDSVGSNAGGPITSAPTPLKIGKPWDGNPINYFSGTIDEVRIWNIARTQEEIQGAMNRPLTSNEINSGNVAGYWNFDDGTADDLSPYGNHGTLMGDAEIVDSDAPIVYTGTINGHVTDLAGEPLGALVIAINAETKEKAGDITDADGYYEIPDLEQGIYWLICIKRDYKLWYKKS